MFQLPKQELQKPIKMIEHRIFVLKSYSGLVSQLEYKVTSQIVKIEEEIQKIKECRARVKKHLLLNGLPCE